MVTVDLTAALGPEAGAALEADATSLQHRPSFKGRWSVDRGQPNPTSQRGKSVEAVAASTGKSSSQKKVRITFDPGKVGFKYSFQTGQINSVSTEGQACRKGVKPGWIMYRIDGERYYKELFIQRCAGTVPFSITFRIMDHSQQGDVTEQGVEKITFEPGKVGMKYVYGTGQVNSVSDGGQAQRCGVQPDWVMMFIDGEPYQKELFMLKCAGSMPYVVTFRTRRDASADKGSAARARSTNSRKPLDTQAKLDWGMQVTFLPGKVGLKYSYDSGLVTMVNPDGQAHQNGVQRGWVMHRIDGEPYFKELFIKKCTGTVPYTVVFTKSSDEADSLRKELTIGRSEVVNAEKSKAEAAVAAASEADQLRSRIESTKHEVAEAKAMSTRTIEAEEFESNKLRDELEMAKGEADQIRMLEREKTELVAAETDKLRDELTTVCNEMEEMRNASAVSADLTAASPDHISAELLAAETELNAMRTSKAKAAEARAFEEVALREELIAFRAEAAEMKASADPGADVAAGTANRMQETATASSTAIVSESGLADIIKMLARKNEELEATLAGKDLELESAQAQTLTNRMRALEEAREERMNPHSSNSNRIVGRLGRAFPNLTPN